MIEMEKEDTLAGVIQDGIRFLESLTIHYGSEKGMAVWESMGEAMGKEIKGKVFFSLLTGTTTGRISFTAHDAEHSNAVPVIKLIRSYTGLGLKEAKDIWDMIKMKPVTFEVASGMGDPRDCARKLRDLGCRVR